MRPKIVFYSIKTFATTITQPAK